MPSPDELRKDFTTQPNGDLAFTIKVIAREGGVEINGHFVGPKEQGFASAAEHFGQYLALLARDDRRKREEDAIPAELVDRWVAAMRRFDVPQGLTQKESSAAFRENGLDPRSSGSWIMHGWLIRDPDTDRRFVTPKGKVWLDKQSAA